VLGGALPLFARTLSIGAGLHLVPFAALALLALIARRLVAADPARSGGLAQEPAG
jgi:hypothetical protein